ncbi:MAG: hypothetical protein ACK4UO_20190 [Pseudolabrys sp.]
MAAREALYNAASWIRDYHAKIDSYRDPPKTLDELQDAVSAESKAGYQDHHIVEQTQAARDGYPRRMIDGRDNVVRIPTMKHEDINGWYQRANRGYDGMSPRDYLANKGWEERRAVGLKALIDHGVLKP